MQNELFFCWKRREKEISSIKQERLCVAKVPLNSWILASQQNICFSGGPVCIGARVRSLAREPQGLLGVFLSSLSFLLPLSHSLGRASASRAFISFVRSGALTRLKTSAQNNTWWLDSCARGRRLCARSSTVSTPPSTRSYTDLLSALNFAVD